VIKSFVPFFYISTFLFSVLKTSFEISIVNQIFIQIILFFFVNLKDPFIKIRLINYFFRKTKIYKMKGKMHGVLIKF